MFIETYYDERAPVPGSTNEPAIPYPELSGEELTVWRKYLPMRRQIKHLHSRFNSETVPGAVIMEIDRAQKVPHLFDRVEIWSRMDDPIAVGVIDREKPRYFSIARWGDAEVTLEEAKERLRAEQRLFSLAASAGILVFLITMFATAAYGWITVGFGFTSN